MKNHMQDFANKDVYNQEPAKKERHSVISLAVSLTAEQMIALAAVVGLVLVLYFAGPVDFGCTTASTACIR